MAIVTIMLLLGAGFAASAPSASSAQLTSNMSYIRNHWGEITPYHDNAPGFFGVKDTGIPDGCQVIQAHLLQRHAQRFPTGSTSDGVNDERFAGKIMNFTKANPNSKFTGPLEFLNTYQYIMSESYLTGKGAATEFNLGTKFWDQYGRILYNATLGQVAFNSSGAGEKKQPKPVLRTTDESRIENSALSWSLGFFGDSFKYIPDQDLSGFGHAYDLVLIHEGGTENDTLASYDNCANSDVTSIGYIGDSDILTYIPLYLKPATARVQKYAPDGFTFGLNDTYAMQSICAYEHAYIGRSDFCNLFTEEEWEGFEYSTDIQYYYDYSYGQPSGRAQGIGYLQELIARLEKEYITKGNTSVNATLDNNAKTFPLDEPFYADFSHDDIIVSVLTAMSMDYFYDKLPVTQYPPPADRHFRLSDMTPFGGHLITEVIGCASSNPAPNPKTPTAYSATQYGFDPSNADHKFVRLRLNDGILPVSQIRGGACGDRSDGLCAMDDFLSSQKNATNLANCKCSFL